MNRFDKSGKARALGVIAALGMLLGIFTVPAGAVGDVDDTLWLPETVIQTSAGDKHTCAVTDDGEAYCWGRGRNGQVGNPDVVGDNDRRIPVPVAEGEGLAAGSVAQVSAGGQHSCAVTGDGDAYCWGLNDKGQRGDGTTSVARAPVQVVNLGQGTLAGRVAQISAGSQHTCAVTVAGDAYCWGWNASGQLGGNTIGDRTTPVKVESGQGLTPGTVAQISAGGRHTCAVTDDGHAYCWGWNGHGQVGDATTGDSPVPVKVDAGQGLTPGTVAQISAGGRHTCAVTDDGDAYCWGNNNRGQIGDGTNFDRAAPVRVGAGVVPAPGTAAHIDAGAETTCSVNTDGVYCWGRAHWTGVGSSTPWKAATGPGVTLVSVGTDHVCVNDQTPGGFCWGENVWGQLGNGGNTSDGFVPTPVLIPYPLPHPFP